MGLTKLTLLTKIIIYYF